MVIIINFICNRFGFHCEIILLVSSMAAHSVKEPIRQCWNIELIFHINVKQATSKHQVDRYYQWCAEWLLSGGAAKYILESMKLMHHRYVPKEICSVPISLQTAICMQGCAKTLSVKDGFGPFDQLL